MWVGLAWQSTCLLMLPYDESTWYLLSNANVCNKLVIIVFAMDNIIDAGSDIATFFNFNTTVQLSPQPCASSNNTYIVSCIMQLIFTSTSYLFTSPQPTYKYKRAASSTFLSCLQCTLSSTLKRLCVLAAPGPRADPCTEHGFCFTSVSVHNERKTRERHNTTQQNILAYRSTTCMSHRAVCRGS